MAACALKSPGSAPLACFILGLSPVPVLFPLDSVPTSLALVGGFGWFVFKIRMTHTSPRTHPRSPGGAGVHKNAQCEGFSSTGPPPVPQLPREHLGHSQCHQLLLTPLCFPPHPCTILWQVCSRCAPVRLGFGVLEVPRCLDVVCESDFFSPIALFLMGNSGRSKTLPSSVSDTWMRGVPFC